MFRFADPYFLILLGLIPLSVWYRRHRVHPPVLAAPNIDTAEALPGSMMLRIARFLNGLLFLALVLMIVALARPQWGSRQMAVDTMGINIALVIDLSESMAALDFHQAEKNINRLEAVKSVVRDFIHRRSGDRIGLVVFGSHAYTQLPLTRDYNTIGTMLERLQIGAAGPRTALGDAIGIALKRLSDIQSRSNVIILLTDGRGNSGEIDPETAAALAARKGVKIYTIGVGSRGRAPFLVQDPVFGRRYIYRQVDLDEETLRMAAEHTGGLYFRAEDLEGLKQIYATIDAMEKTAAKAEIFVPRNEFYPFLLLAAFGLIGLWIVLNNTRFLKLP